MNDMKVILPPNPGRLVEGLRDTGYDFNTALADVIDNSIDAGADKIDINIHIELDNSIFISIADNGCGMTSSELLNGMTYGASGKFNPQRLGKFGLGLKTASTAFCRKLVVVTRSNKDNLVNKAVWDLDHIVECDAWELLLPEVDQMDLELFEKTSRGGNGTLVIWSNVDRVLKNSSEARPAQLRRGLKKLIEDFKQHASMVYQRFLDTNDKRARNIDFFVNDVRVLPWDPFCQVEPQSELVAEKYIDVELQDGSNSKFSLKAFVIPRREQFSTQEAATNARVQNNMQGIYIYRENRLIHSADWLGMFSKEPHLSLLRVEFSFDHTLDSAFHVDIKKSQIVLNDDLYLFIKEQFLPAPRNAADERYRKGQRVKANEKSINAHASSNRTIGENEKNLVGSSVQVVDINQDKAEVTNRFGKSMIKIKISDSFQTDEVNVKAEDSLDDGFLWLPGLINNHHAVRINMSHPFYHKVYIPNLNSEVTIQGLDSLLWALVEAEFSTINESTKRHFEELRFEVSRILRKLVEDLPDPEL